MKQSLHWEVSEFVIYSRRSYLILYLVLFLGADLLYTVLLFFSLFIATGIPIIGLSDLTVFVITLQIIMMVVSLLVLFTLVLLFPFTLSTIFRLVSHRPALLISHQGVGFQDLPVTGTIFFPWSEIASLSIVPVPQTLSKPLQYLCLDLKDRTRFLARFHPLRRFFITLGSMATGTLVHVPQWFLSQPVEEILLQIREVFQNQLRELDIQILISYPVSTLP